MEYYDNGSNWYKWDLHVHTASSYDYEYKGVDCDQLLVQAWLENDIKVVAITDHFLIDKERIENLRLLAKENGITILPGVELRTDKGDSNVHVILIFSERIDLEILESDFESQMIRGKAKPKESHSDENIYWDYEDIKEFANRNNAIISIHAGSKSNGVDDRISNALKMNLAVKTEYAESVDIFEVGTLRNIEDYKSIVFKSIDERPVIICSDNHDARNYNLRENLWIKANPSFDGLKQAIIHQSERVYVGEIPPKLHNLQLNPEKYIKTIIINKKIDAKNSENWFDVNLSINPGLTTIIGNKGSGKSALADLIGYMGNSDNQDSFSFLSKDRFCREDKSFNLDYDGSVLWHDNELTAVNNFNLNRANGYPLVRYLPQRYIEDTCNNLDYQFQPEIDKVIFSYVDAKDRANSNSLRELIDEKQELIEKSAEKLRLELSRINEDIIELERKTNPKYIEEIKKNRVHYENELKRHKDNKPKEIDKPKNQTDRMASGLEHINNFNKTIDDLDNQIYQTETQVIVNKNNLFEMENFKEKIELQKNSIAELKETAEQLNLKYSINPAIVINFAEEISGLNLTIKKQKEEILQAERLLEDEGYIPNYNSETSIELIESEYTNSSSLLTKKAIVLARINRAKEMLGMPQRIYQKYLDDMKKWEMKEKTIIGDVNNRESLSYFVKLDDYVETTLETDLLHLKEKRNIMIIELYKLIMKKKEVLDQIYEPIEVKFNRILYNIEDKLSFEATVQVEHNFVQDILEDINQSIVSKFRGKIEGQEYLKSLLRKYDFNSQENVVRFVNEVLDAITEDEEKSDLIVRNRDSFYNYLCGLEYLNVGFSLTMGNKKLEQLSPGEKGIVLLIFYLALDREDKPLIIDQPEDNLDNQSVYSKLVPCVLEAKKNRQVILVTHNPNLAIACDSELVVTSQECDANKIYYSAGAIEDNMTKENIVNILEGTQPAFDLRSSKYSQKKR